MKISISNIIFSVLLLFSLNIHAQDPLPVEITKNDELYLFNLIKECLALPNDANYPEDIEKNILWCEDAFSKRGFTTERLATGAEIPLLLANYTIQNPDLPTVLIYLQIDGQPVDTNFWWQDNPYEATLKNRAPDGEWKPLPWEKLQGEVDPEWRIYARSTADAKGSAMLFLAAMDFLQRERVNIPYNVKVIMDFEEELGSPNLAKGVELNRKSLEADHLIIFDGSVHPSYRPTLTFGARGITTVTLKVHGPIFPQHSGHYGNYVPNPAIQLSRLIGSMKDDYGRVLIPGWYDGITLDEDTKTILRNTPDDEPAIRAKLGIKEADQVAPTLQEALQYPSLNVRGMLSGWIGKEVRTIIPSLATAEIDIRTVKESNPQVLMNHLVKHIKKQGFFITSDKPTIQEKLSHRKVIELSYKVSYQAFRTELDSPTGLWLRRALTRVDGQEPVMKRTSGGSIPISPFVNTLGVPAVTVPLVNPDNNQHSPNENVRIGSLMQGLRTVLFVLTEPI